MHGAIHENQHEQNDLNRPEVRPHDFGEHDRLTADLCQIKAREALALAHKAASQSHRIMLEHIAETWYRIADKISANDS